MRHCISVASMILFAAACNAAALKGVVVENEVGGPPASDVEITSQGANPTKTGSDGQFALSFPNKKPGEIVQASVRKAGFVVVNDIQLEQVLSANADAKPFLILICKPANREEMARRYYRLRSIEAVEANYERRFKELQAANADVIAHLEKERDQARNAAEKAAEELAKLKPGQTSEVYNQAMRLFLDGRIEEALKVLDDEKLRHNLEAARQRKEDAEKEIEQTAQSWTLKAGLLTIQFKVDEADQAYREALQAAPKSFGVCFAFAKFSQDLNRYDTARNEYRRCLTIAQQDKSDVELAAAFNNLGMVYSDQGQVDDARGAYEQALAIRRRLATRDLEIQQIEIAITLNNLGNLYSKQNSAEEADKAYREALGILRTPANTNPWAYLPHLSLTLMNVGNTYRTHGRLDDARQAYEQAADGYRVLADQNPQTYSPPLAATLGNLGSLYLDRGRIVEAFQKYAESLEIFHKLSANNPEAYQYYVAGALNGLGRVYRAQGRTNDALPAHEEALKIFEGLAAKSPETYQSDVASTLNDLGMLYRDQNRMNDALWAFEKEGKILTELASKNPERYMPGLAIALNNIGNLHADQNRVTEAQMELRQALNILEPFAKRDPAQFQEKVVQLRQRLAELGKQ